MIGDFDAMPPPDAYFGFEEVITDPIEAKGLQNADGANHCFLNVCIQTLWNVRSFRARFFDATHRHTHLDESQTSTCCLCALKCLFSAYESADDDVLPPDRLRETLSKIYGSEGRFIPGSMEDATETIEALLDVIHANSLDIDTSERQRRKIEGKIDVDATGQCGGSASSSCLSPVAVCTKAAASFKKAPETPSGSILNSDDKMGAVAELDSESAKASSEVVFQAASVPCQPLCIAHEVFGIEYVDMVSCSFCGATSEPGATRTFSMPVYVAELSEVLNQRRTSTLRDRLNDSCPEPTRRSTGLDALLRTVHSRTYPGEKCKACHSLLTLASERWLTCCPSTLVFSLIWPQYNPSRTLQRLVLQSLQPVFSLEHAFKTRPAGSPKSDSKEDCSNRSPWESGCAERLFTGMVCYRGMHYIAIFWSWTLGAWIRFDDTSILRGHNWESVVRSVLENGYIPTLLFYDACPGSDDSSGNPANVLKEEFVSQMRVSENASECACL